MLAAPLLALAAACGGGGADEVAAGHDFDAEAIAQSVEGVPFMPIIVNSTVGLGENRLVFALLRADRTLVADAEITLRLTQLDTDANGAITAERAVSEHTLTARMLSPSVDHAHADGSRHEHTSGAQTVYVGHATLDISSFWGAELDVTAGGERYEGVRLRFFVRDATEPAEPRVGEPVPRSRQLTLADVRDIREIDSTLPPNPQLHDITVADALETGRPVVIAFATPAFCVTRFCGPIVERVLLPLSEQFAGRAEFLHIEPFVISEAREGRLEGTETTAEWQLRSDPWIFVVDAQGVMFAKFEGIVEQEEVAEALERLLAR